MSKKITDIEGKNTFEVVYDFNLLTDDDGITSAVGLNCAEYVDCKADEIEVLVIENTYTVKHNKYKVA